MKPHLVEMLACPFCGGELDLDIELQIDDEVAEGVLRGHACEHRFTVSGGIPRLLDTADEASHVAESFGFEWDRFHRGAFESDTVFGLTADQDRRSFFEGLDISPADLVGALVLDAGCGSGRLTVDLARRHPEATFVALDINPAIEHVFRASLDLPNLHVVRGSVLSPPFRAGLFDYVWSNGVIHHTGDTRGAFDALAAKTRTGGRAYLWVYERKPSPLVALRRLLAPLRPHDWDRRVLYAFCWTVSVPTWLAVKLLAPLRRSSRVRSSSRLRVLTRDREMRELVLTWFDVLSPQHRDVFSEDEMEGWFREQGFTDLSRYWWPVGISGTRTAAEILPSRKDPGRRRDITDRSVSLPG